MHMQSLKPTSTRIWIALAAAIVTTLWSRESLVAGDYGDAIVSGLTGALLGYLAAPGLEYVWVNRNRSGDFDRGAILATGGVAALLAMVAYPWLTGQNLDRLTITLFVVLAAGCAEAVVRIRRRLKST